MHIFAGVVVVTCLLSVVLGFEFGLVEFAPFPFGPSQNHSCFERDCVQVCVFVLQFHVAEGSQFQYGDVCAAVEIQCVVV